MRSERFGDTGSLRDVEFAPSPADRAVRGRRFNELKPVTEGVVLADDRVDLNRIFEKRELKTNDFADGEMFAQHDGDSRETEIERGTTDDRGAAWINADWDFELEPGATAVLNHKAKVLVTRR